MATSKKTPPPAPDASTVKKAPVKSLADFEKKYPTLNIAEYLEQIGIEHGLISRS